MSVSVNIFTGAPPAVPAGGAAGVATSVVSNGIPGLSAPVIIVNTAGDPTAKRFEKLHFARFPWCFVTKGSHESFLTQEDLLVKRHVTYCKLPVSLGAGYDVDLVPWKQVAQWRLFRTRFLILAPKHVAHVYPAPTYTNIQWDLGPNDNEEFMSLVRRYSGMARGKVTATTGGASSKEFRWNPFCGCCEHKTLTVQSDGYFQWEHSTTAFTSTVETDAGWLDDVGYIHTTTAGPCSGLCCGLKNTIQIAAPKDKAALVGPMFQAQVPEAHAELLKGMLGRAPAAPLKRWEGGNGYAEVGPEFTTVNVRCNPTLNKFTCGLCDRTEVTSFRTSDIAFLRAGLPSWQNAFIKMVREVELFRLYNTVQALYTVDLALLPVWPCQFCSDAKLALTLFMVAALRISAFLYLFFCRKTNVLFGGPGHAKMVAFPVDAEPEKRLRDISNTVKAANAQFEWFGYVNNGTGVAGQVNGAAKGMPIAISDGGSVIQINPLATKSLV